MDYSWTGKTFFRVFGPYDSKVQASEVREALTDFEFVGQEKMGDYMVSLFLLLASVVCLSRTTKQLFESLKMENQNTKNQLVVVS